MLKLKITASRGHGKFVEDFSGTVILREMTVKQFMAFLQDRGLVVTSCMEVKGEDDD